MNNAKIVIYDADPGKGFMQYMLKTSWLLGCKIQKVFGLIDDYRGFKNWGEAKNWLESLPITNFSYIQFWGHGSPACVWMAGKRMPNDFFDNLKQKIDINTIIWFRCCSVFSGMRGIGFSEALANKLNCYVAGHTRIIGPLQPGLHLVKPNQTDFWPPEEGQGKDAIASWLEPDSRTIFCLQTKVPKKFF